MADEALKAARSLDRDLPEDLADAVAAHLPGHRVDRVMNHTAPVQSLRVADDGRVVVRTAGAEAFIWGVDRDRPELRIDLGGPARQGRSMAAAGGALVVCLENGPLTVFSLDTGRRLRSFRAHPGVATCVDFSADGSTIASGGSDRALRLWNVQSGECERTLQGHQAFISALAWHPTEPVIVTGERRRHGETVEFRRGTLGARVRGTPGAHPERGGCRRWTGRPDRWTGRFHRCVGHGDRREHPFSAGPQGGSDCGARGG